MPREGIQNHRGGGLLSHGFALVPRNETGLYIAGNILETLDIFGPSPFGSDLDEKQAAEDTGQNAHGRAGHADVHGIRVAPVSYTHLDVYKRQH